jgi:CheY-like chemotaxis protein
MNKIFLIDDDEDDQLLFKEVIEFINPRLHCETVTNGRIALDKLKVSASLPDILSQRVSRFCIFKLKKKLRGPVAEVITSLPNEQV